MIKLLFSFFLVFSLFTGCSMQNTPEPNDPLAKAFEEEDLYALFALDAQQNEEYQRAAGYYSELYTRSHKREYLFSMLDNLMAAEYYNDVVSVCDKQLSENPDDFALRRYKIAAMVKLGHLQEAKTEAIALVQQTKAALDYVLVSDILILLKQYDLAIKYLESGYHIGYNEQVLDKLAIILYVNLDRKADAISYLETHSRLNGCSEIICKRLAGFYSDQNNIDGALNIYLRLYDYNGDPEAAEVITRIYTYKKEWLPLMRFLEKSKSDDDLLLQLYVGNKMYDKAYKLSYAMYEKNGDENNLADSAIFQYEAAKDKNDTVMLKSVLKKLKDAVYYTQKGLYLNYLGYLMIDHDIDVKGGMKYIQEALKKEPDSVYYLDSLAWGYYKLGKCTKAFSIMKEIMGRSQSLDKEVMEHYETIKKCKRAKK